jgi:hypothetical protein
MELLCSLLTGFFLWLLLFRWRRRTTAFDSQRAGPLLAKVNVPRGRRAFLCMSALFFVLLVLSAVYVFAIARAGSFEGDVVIGMLLTLVLAFAIPIGPNTTLEVHEQGVLYNCRGNNGCAGTLTFTPWSRIGFCQWTWQKVATRGRAGRPFTIAWEAVPIEQRDAVTAAIGRFVPILDRDGSLLAEPKREDDAAEREMSSEFEGPQFQFDLQAMLLMAVVVAFAGSLIAMHRR